MNSINNLILNNNRKKLDDIINEINNDIDNPYISDLNILDDQNVFILQSCKCKNITFFPYVVNYKEFIEISLPSDNLYFYLIKKENLLPENNFLKKENITYKCVLFENFLLYNNNNFSTYYQSEIKFFINQKEYIHKKNDPYVIILTNEILLNNIPILLKLDNSFRMFKLCKEKNNTNNFNVFYNFYYLKNKSQLENLIYLSLLLTYNFVSNVNNYINSFSPDFVEHQTNFFSYFDELIIKLNKETLERCYQIYNHIFLLLYSKNQCLNLLYIYDVILLTYKNNKFYSSFLFDIENKFTPKINYLSWEYLGNKNDSFYVKNSKFLGTLYKKFYLNNTNLNELYRINIIKNKIFHFNKKIIVNNCNIKLYNFYKNKINNENFNTYIDEFFSNNLSNQEKNIIELYYICDAEILKILNIENIILLNSKLKKIFVINDISIDYKNTIQDIIDQYFKIINFDGGYDIQQNFNKTDKILKINININHLLESYILIFCQLKKSSNEKQDVFDQKFYCYKTYYNSQYLNNLPCENFYENNYKNLLSWVFNINVNKININNDDCFIEFTDKKIIFKENDIYLSLSSEEKETFLKKFNEESLNFFSRVIHEYKDNPFNCNTKFVIFIYNILQGINDENFKNEMIKFLYNYIWNTNDIFEEMVMIYNKLYTLKIKIYDINNIDNVNNEKNFKYICNEMLNSLNIIDFSENVKFTELKADFYKFLQNNMNQNDVNDDVNDDDDDEKNISYYYKNFLENEKTENEKNYNFGKEEQDVFKRVDIEKIVNKFIEFKIQFENFKKSTKNKLIQEISENCILFIDWVIVKKNNFKNYFLNMLLKFEDSYIKPLKLDNEKNVLSTYYINNIIKSLKNFINYEGFSDETQQKLNNILTVNEKEENFKIDENKYKKNEHKIRLYKVKYDISNLIKMILKIKKFKQNIKFDISLKDKIVQLKEELEIKRNEVMNEIEQIKKEEIKNDDYEKNINNMLNKIKNDFNLVSEIINLLDNDINNFSSNKQKILLILNSKIYNSEFVWCVLENESEKKIENELIQNGNNASDNDIKEHIIKLEQHNENITNPNNVTTNQYNYYFLDMYKKLCYENKKIISDELKLNALAKDEIIKRYYDFKIKYRSQKSVNDYLFQPILTIKNPEEKTLLSTNNDYEYLFSYKSNFVDKKEFDDMYNYGIIINKFERCEDESGNII